MGVEVPGQSRSTVPERRPPAGDGIHGCGRRASPDRGEAPAGRERDGCLMTRRPNVLLIMTDQQQYPPSYEFEELAAFRREHLAGVERLRQNGVSFRHHYPMSA